MPRVITEKKISGLSIDTVWLIAKDLESYPKFMDQVKSVEFIDAVEGVITSSWVVLFNGNELRWTEVDEFDNIRHRMSFRQIEGDLAKWEGSFEAIAVDGGVQCRYDVEFWSWSSPGLMDTIRIVRGECHHAENEESLPA